MKLPTETISIKAVTVRYLAVILLVALAGVSLVAAIGSHYSQEIDTRHQGFELDVLSGDIGDLVRFYRHIAESAARRQEAVDLLQFGDVERASEWAKSMRSIVPESIGVALVAADGSVLGEPLQLRLGEQCVADLEHSFNQELVSQPPVHAEVEALAHFDIIVPVEQGGEQLGLLFMSFSLDVLKQRIRQWTKDDRYLSIREGSGSVIVETGNASFDEDDECEERSARIPGTDWMMYYRTHEHRTARLSYMAMGVGGVVFLATVILAWFFSARIVGIFRSDLHLIRKQLDQVHAGDESGADLGTTLLRETESIMADVSDLVQQIGQSNLRLKQQSRHDPLTGLYNRRAFDEALAQSCSLAVRGGSARLILLDLDLFKQVNDRYGHGVGDEVLVALAESLHERCRGSDVLARLGGDEFGLILQGAPAGGNDLDGWFADIENSFIDKQARINGGEGIDPHCRISAGSALIDESSGADVKQLMEMADKQLYEAKRIGRAVICY